MAHSSTSRASASRPKSGCSSVHRTERRSSASGLWSAGLKEPGSAAQALGRAGARVWRSRRAKRLRTARRHAIVQLELRLARGPTARHAALRAPAGCEAACQLVLDAQGSQSVIARVELGTVSVMSLGQPVFSTMVELRAGCQQCAFHAMQCERACLLMLQSGRVRHGSALRAVSKVDQGVRIACRGELVQVVGAQGAAQEQEIWAIASLRGHAGERFEPLENPRA